MSPIWLSNDSTPPRKDSIPPVCWSGQCLVFLKILTDLTSRNEFFLYVFQPLPMGYTVDLSVVSYENETKCNYFELILHWTVWCHRDKPAGKHILRGSKWVLSVAFCDKPEPTLLHLCSFMKLRVKAGGTSSAHFQSKVSARNCVWYQCVQELPSQDEDGWTFHSYPGNLWP